MERVAQQHILQSMEESKQLNGSSHAYRRNYSTATTLSEVLDEVYKSTEEKKMTQLMTLDLSAAFDTVSHPLLLLKLRRYGLHENVVKWIEDYISMRTQYVEIGRAKSTMQQVYTGVPQGSVIGPLLYSIFVNEITGY